MISILYCLCTHECAKVRKKLRFGIFVNTVLSLPVVVCSFEHRQNIVSMSLRERIIKSISALNSIEYIFVIII